MVESQKNGKTVRLDQELMDTLAEKRQGFETPSDCIKRMLLNKPCETKENSEEESKE